MIEKKRFGVVNSPYSPSSLDISRAVIEAGHEIVDVSGKSPRPVDGVIVSGGDGFVRQAITELVDENEEAPLVVINAAGTNNTLYRTISRMSESVEIDRFLKDGSEIKPVEFRPGLIDGRLFAIDVDLGRVLPEVARVNEKLRQSVMGRLGRSGMGRLRLVLAAAAGLSKTLVKPETDKPLMNLFSLSPFYGKKVVFPEQDFQGDKITRVWAEGSKIEQYAKVFFGLLGLGLGLPWLIDKVLEKEQVEEYKIDYPNDIFWLGGDLVTDTPLKDGAVVKRSEVMIKAVAIK